MRVAAYLFAEHGIAGTSVRDIADEVGMLSGSLYHHFSSKDAIAVAILGDFLADLNARYQSVLPHVVGMRQQLRALVNSSIVIAEKHPYATEIYQNERSLHGPESPAAIAEAVARAHEFWTATATQASDAGELRAELDPTDFARMLRESVWWSVRYHRDALAERQDEITESLLAVFVDGAATPIARDVKLTAAEEVITERLDRIEEALKSLDKNIIR